VQIWRGNQPPAWFEIQGPQPRGQGVYSLLFLTFMTYTLGVEVCKPEDEVGRDGAGGLNGNISLGHPSLATVMLRAATPCTRHKCRPLGPSKVKSSSRRGINCRPRWPGPESGLLSEPPPLPDSRRRILASLLCADWLAARIFNDT